MKRKAFTLIETIVVVAVVGGLLAFLFPKVANKDVRNADHSQKATQELAAAQNEKEGSIAASVTVMGQAAAAAPRSPETDFIIHETPFVLGMLQPANAKKLIEASERRAAVAEGKVEAINYLYGQAAESNQKLLKKVSDAEAYREKVDLQLSEAAYYKLGAQRAQMAMGAVILLLVAGVIYFKVYGVNTKTIGGIVAGIKAGENPITVIDEYLPKWMHRKVDFHARAATPVPDKTSS